MTDSWGFTVAASMESYSWTKLLLDRTSTLTDFDDPSLRNLMGFGMMRLPVDKSAKEVCEDFLTGLHHYTAMILAKKYSPEIYDITPVECWITVPAIWSDAAKNATRSAAMMAGFGSRPNDAVNIITEPEAAALAALKPHVDPRSIDPVHPGENILVCDCGGGTVDITTYKIMEASPRLLFKELCVGIGGKVGSTYIDRNFNKWLSDTFGEAYTRIPAKKRGPGSAFMRSFETAKRAFGSNLDGRNEMKFIEIEHLYMKCSWSSSFDEDENTLKLTSADMQSFFDPVVSDVLRLITSQADRAKSLGHPVDRVILVGGFGDSDYLVGRIRSWCEAQTVRAKLTCPPQCQAAIVRGAALRGLEGLKPSSRISRRHYGHPVGLRFRDGRDPEQHAYHNHWHDKKYCSSRVDWGVRKGQEINDDFEVELEVGRNYYNTDLRYVNKAFHVKLLCCSSDDAPEQEFEAGVEKVGTISTEFSDLDFASAPKRFKQGIGWIHRLEYVIKIRFSAEEGVLVFSTWIEGRQAGHTKVEFHDT
ncbi:hsp70-like protein [Phyllosticta citribraziliensis]|uniref:Hsp70-like protein n=1 Tax=Phyllosticta citribraziliensis TaxID=989973 RepID=A0ABR1LXS4_9PEZI